MNVEKTEVDMFECEHFQPWFARINPELSTPVLVDNGQTMTNPREIMLHLCEKNPESGLLPTDTESKEKVMKWVDRVFNEWDSIYEFSIYAGNQRQWPQATIRGPFDTDPEPPKLEPINRDEKLAELALDPEFIDIAMKKQQQFN